MGEPDVPQGRPGGFANNRDWQPATDDGGISHTSVVIDPQTGQYHFINTGNGGGSGSGLPFTTKAKLVAKGFAGGLSIFPSLVNKGNKNNNTTTPPPDPDPNPNPDPVDGFDRIAHLFDGLFGSSGGTSAAPPQEPYSVPVQQSSTSLPMLIIIGGIGIIGYFWYKEHKG